MTNISTVNSGTPGRVAAVGSDSTVRPAARAREAGASRGTDRAEFTPMAQMLSRLRALPEVRQDLIDEVRAKIAEGGYDTDEKLDAVMDQLIQDAREA